MKPTNTSNHGLARSFAALDGDAQRSIADLTDSEADSFGRLAGENAFLAALEAGVGVAVLKNDEILIVSKPRVAQKPNRD